jgi:hypothetical protein
MMRTRVKYCTTLLVQREVFKGKFKVKKIFAEATAAAGPSSSLKPKETFIQKAGEVLQSPISILRNRAERLLSDSRQGDHQCQDEEHPAQHGQACHQGQRPHPS